ncbi:MULTISPECIES: DUF4437 domain-containing protein [unclassified Lentimonas]|uniref:DUF4437 domain-containing protein n=1 Tax=unclassified Lentimonas TaxID=2630993 RepID=UPI00132738FF|nr:MULTISPECIES: DUF4437 domain-containing protein [unclassified Lentimonas]CAA6676814.1 Unannotated [Lentimonas sp. CC4]CAA6686621.1 Unannotated [Lentimonas sp. CC6]CAA7075802.1 Unannotated [Lentimonas sp. CC4]CAA7168034.1 Unannotated [Lentimonas sp. CC21]CAA7183021.1 Unannotated [Lentimonas sp. CC8]
MKVKTTLLLTVVLAANAAFAAAKIPKDSAPEDLNVEVVLASEVEWTHLNPKRGDLAPKAGTLWGDRNGTVPTGYLLKPPAQFESPPHIHNVSYRAVVIRGLFHNDDPDAAELWMPAGSFWTQPKGEVHITAAKGAGAMAYIEIEAGPYLVMPADEAFDSGERPVNVVPSNMVWLDASDVTWVEAAKGSVAGNGPQVAFLWGNTQDGELNGTYIKLPAGFSGTIRSHGDSFRAIVVDGSLHYQMPGESSEKVLEPGSYLNAPGTAVLQLSSDASTESIVYVRTDGRYEVLPE